MKLDIDCFEHYSKMIGTCWNTNKFYYDLFNLFELMEMCVTKKEDGGVEKRVRVLKNERKDWKDIKWETLELLVLEG